jgi:hypothetical protein
VCSFCCFITVVKVLPVVFRPRCTPKGSLDRRFGSWFLLPSTNTSKERVSFVFFYLSDRPLRLLLPLPPPPTPPPPCLPSHHSLVSSKETEILLEHFHLRSEKIATRLYSTNIHQSTAHTPTFIPNVFAVDSTRIETSNWAELTLEK